MMNYFKKQTDERGIVTLTFDTPESNVNVLSFDALYEFEQYLTEMKANKTIKILFIESAKKNIFIAGADIKEIKDFKDEEDIIRKLRHGQEIFNTLESLPFVTIAVIDGACLGGGLELAMACDYRIVSNASHTRLGLVEVSLGIIPGLGGTQRMPRLVGFTKAIELISASKRLKGDKALKLGLVDASVPSGYLTFKKEEFIRDILEGKLEGKVNKRRQGIKWYERILPMKYFIAKIAKKHVLKRTYGHYPAPIKAIDVLEHSAGLSLDEGLKLELKAFAPLAVSKISKNLIELFFTSEALKKETFSRAKPHVVESAAVIGVGTMGSGIAWSLANKDIPVRLGARKMHSIAEAVSRIMMNFEQIRRRGRLNEREIGLKVDRITYTTDMEGFSSQNIIIEAVSEDPEVKKEIYRILETNIPKDTVIATNTSSLGITSLVEDTLNPERFIGMHFFNPVSKMPLVEVIAGQRTNDRTIATVVGLAKKLDKIPIRVKECAGFLVNRILLPYLNESARMFEEGEHIEHIDKVLFEFGMPMGPFTLADEVGIDIGEKVSDILYKAYGERMRPVELLGKMRERMWLGKKSGRGFYIHQGRSKILNEDIKSLQIQRMTLDEVTILNRALLIMINEAARCLEEKVVSNAQYLDMAMVIGTGFPAFRGGLLRYADAQGIVQIIEILECLKEAYGERFTPADLLVEMAQKGKTFYGEG